MFRTVLVLFLLAMPVSAYSTVVSQSEQQGGSDSFSDLSPATKKVRTKARKSSDSYRLEIARETDNDEVKRILSRLKKLHISPVTKKTVPKEETMYCLLYGSYNNGATAKSELAKLRKLAPKAFLVKKNDKHLLYAASFKKEGKAAIEQDRLYDAGIKQLVMKQEKVTVEATSITAGSFSDRRGAEAALAQLKKAAIAAVVK